MKRVFRHTTFFVFVFSLLLILLTVSQFVIATFRLDEHYKAFYYGVNTWEKSIDELEKIKLKPSRWHSYYRYQEGRDFVTDTFEWINFKNDKASFLMLDSLLKGKLKPSKNADFKLTPNGRNYLHFNFYWDNIDGIADNLNYKEDEHLYYTGLFSITFKKTGDTYFFYGIHTEQPNLNKIEPYFREDEINLHEIQYEFKRNNTQIDVKNCTEFNFIFWKQAQDYINKEINDYKFGNTFIFQCNGKKIATFIYNQSGDYQIKL
jgi:hypothetical protein